MNSFLRLPALALVAALLWGLSQTAVAGVRDFELLSINAGDTASGSGASLNPVISSNGRYVAFVSDASNLVANDNNGTRDVFWRDRNSGTTRLVSRTASGASGNGDSDAPAISPDGRYVAFHSRASNLVGTDSNTNYDVFVWDAHDNSVTLVSRTAAGASGAGDSFSPQISASGRIVSFASMAADLVANDTNGTSDAFARDLDLGVTYLASINTNGFSGNGSCGVPVLSANGRYVAFLSRAGDLVANDTNALNDVFVHDLQTRVTTLVSVNVAGTGAGNRLSFDPVISADGRYIAFASQATNLVTIPDNNNFPDTFVRDMQLGVTKLVSVNRFGTAAGGNGGVPTVLPASFTPFLSADGSKVLFVSLAQDLVANDTNGKQDVFLRDHVSNTTTLVSVNRFGTASGNAASGIGAASMSADLRYVAFFSEASNVGTADTNSKTDVFLRDLDTNSTKIISRVNLGGFAANGHSFQPVISADASTILFTSEADNLDNRDANGASDVFAAPTTLGAPNFGTVDVAVSITSVSARTIGAPFTLTITVTNHSASPATELVLSNTGPDFLRFVSASVSQGVVDPTVLNWQLGDLAANGSATATVTLVATNLGAGDVVTSIIERDQPDANPSNNSALSTVIANQTTAGALFHLPGETAYLSRTNSPFFAQILAGTVTVEDFESGAFNLLGVTASTGDILTPSPSTDSVDGDDGAVDGSGTGGHSFYVWGIDNAVTFTFNPVVFGRLPTKVGIVLTDGGLAGAGIEAFDTNGISLGVIGPFEIGDNSFFGETAEDRFMGVEFAGGISAFRVYTPGGGFEVDHLQFNLPSTDLELSGTAPSSAIVGSNFVVTLSVTNLGPRAVTSAVVTNAEPGPISLVSAVATTGAFDPMTGRWNLGGLAAGSGATLTLTLAATNLGQVVFESRVLSEAVDPNPTNNAVTRTVPVPNRPPVLTVVTNLVVVSENAGAQALAGFASASAVEPGQAITNVMVRSLTPGLFLAQPALTTNGTLTFTAATNTSGTSVVEVLVQDDGGTANGGVDRTTNTFTITVNAYVSVSYTWLGGTGDWHDPARWSPNGVPGAQDSATISGGSVQLTNAVTVGGLSLASATLTGGGSLTIATNLSWTGGTLDGTGALTINTGATATASGVAIKTLQRQLNNAGTFTWTAGTIRGNSAPTVNNQAGAVFDIQVDNTFFDTTDSSVRTFNNAGTLRKSSGVGTTTWQGVLNNTGTVEVQTGTLVLNGSGLSSGSFMSAPGTTFGWTAGTHELTNGVTFTGAGTWALASATLDVKAGTTVSPSGTFALSTGTLGGVGDFTVPAGSTFAWTGGTIHTGGVFTVATGGSLTASGVAIKTLQRQLNNAGTFTWTAGTIRGNSAPTVNNQAGAVFDIQVDNTFFDTTDSSVRTFNNAGTLRKTAGVGTTTWQGVLNNTGTVEVQTGTVSLNGSGLSSGTFAGSSGAVLVWAAGTHVVTNGTTFTGLGTRRITSSATLEVAAGSAVSPEGVFELASGTLGGAGNFTVPAGSAFTWSAGTLGTGGVFTVAAGGTLAMSSPGTKMLKRQFDNLGTVTWTGGTVQGNSNPTFNNQAGAVFDLQVDGNFFQTTDSSVRTFNNAGTLRRTAGTGFTTWEGTLNNTGLLELQTGTFNLPAGYAPAAGGALTVFIGGLTAGTQFARLVGGTTTFAGTLNVVLTNSFSPALSNSFAVVDSSSGGSGAFSATTGRSVAGGLILETIYSGGDLTLQALAVNSAPTFTLTNFPPADGVQDWTRDAVNNPGAGRKVAVDASGNIIVAGDYDAPGGEVSQRDLIVVKYNAAGGVVWSNTVDANSLFADRLAGLALDAAGNVLLLSSSISSTTNFVTVKFLADGTLAWTRFFDGDGEDEPAAIATDSAGNVFVTGSVPSLLNQGHADYVTIKYAPNGDPQWTNTTSYSGPGSDKPRAMAVDGSGDVIVTGTGSDTDYSYAFTVKIAGIEGTNMWTRHFSTDNDNNNSDGKAVAVDSANNVLVGADLLESGIYKFAVVKYSAAGDAQWTNTFTRSGVDASVRGLAVDASGNAILTGVSYNGTDSDFTTIKYDGATGNGVWTNHYDLGGAGSGDQSNAIAVNAAGDVFVTGHSFATNGKDYLTVKYSAAGVGVWTNRYDSAGSMSIDDDAHALAVDTSGNVYVTGESDTMVRTVKYAVIPSSGASQTVTNSVGAVTIPGFVVSSSVGTTNESSQTLSFTVTNDNNGLFSVQPAISAAGVLTYTVNGGVSGVAVVTVRAQDTGGSANGGVDTSAPQSFSITVVSNSTPITYVWGGGTGNWNDPAHWTPAGVPGVADTVTISSGNAQVTNAVAVHTLTLTGGFISGAGSLSIRSAMTWSGGTLIGAGTTTIANGAVLTVNGGVDKDLRRRLDNYGTVTWTTGRILGHDAATIYNYAGALFDTKTDATLFESGDGTTKTFNNFGTVRKSAGTGTSAWSGAFNNSGTVNVQTGTLNPSGTVTLNTSSYTGTGQFMLTGATLAGTLTIAAEADVDFASGSLLGTGTIVGTMSWTGGTFGPGGTTTIATNGVLLISGATQKDLRHTLDNYGTVTWTGERILGHQAPVIVNRAGALFDAQANTTLYESGDGTIKNFHNSGTVRRTVGTGTTTWNGRFNNDAVLRVETGVVALNGGGTSAGTFTNLAGATLEFSGGTHTLNDGTIFTGAGTNLIDGGTVNVSAGATATATGIFSLASGTLGGTGTLLATSGSQFNWTGGAMDGTTGITAISSGATLIASSGADKDLRRRLDNYGTVTWTAGRILGHSTPVINNFAGALFDTQSDATLFESGDGTVKTFNNFGTVRKSGGTGSSIWLGVFNHSGAADVQTGTLNPDGTVTLNTSSYSGAGRFLITGATLAGTLTIAGGANVEISGSSVGGSGTVVGTLNWTSGTLGTGGTLTIATNGVLVASGVLDKDLRQTLDNYGTVTWTDGRIVGHSSPVIVNRAGALFDVQTQVNATLFESGDGTIKTFNNLGVVRRTVGTGTTTWNGLFNNNAVLRVETGLVALNGGGTSAGTFTNLSGATLEFSGGTHTLNHGTLFTGAGTNLIDGGTVNVSTNATATATGTFTLSTGTLGGTGTLLVTSGSQFNWTGGTMAGTTGITVITNGATLIASSAADKDLRRRLDNYGTVTWTAGRIVGHSTPVINNYAGALFDTQTSETLFESGDGTIKTFNNSGTLRKSAGTGTTTVYGTFNLGGTANVQTGTLNPIGTVTATSVSYSGAGRFLFTTGTLSGTQTVAAGANVELASGTLLGTWALAGTMNWTSGSLGSGGSTTIPVGSTLLVSGAADKDLRRTLNNSGTVLWTAGRLLGHSTPIINNLAGAVFETQVAATLFESGDGTIKTFNNSGTVRKTTSTGTTAFHGTFNNSSVLEIQLGILSLVNGYSPAAGSSLKVFLGGLTAGTQFGQLQVTGSTAFTGTLNIVLTNGFTPSVLNSFLIVNSSVGGSGAFSTVTGDDLGGGLALVSNYLLGDLTLVAQNGGAALPPLAPRVDGGGRVLRLPAGVTGYELQTATAITGPWTPVLTPVEQENGESIVRLTSEGTRFYRLVRPTLPRPGDNPTQ